MSALRSGSVRTIYFFEILFNRFSCFLLINTGTHPFKESVAHRKIKNKIGGGTVPDKIVNILESIKEAKGQEYVEGLVDMANLLAPRKTESEAAHG